MSKKLEKAFPPYIGENPYIFLCFSDKDFSEIDDFLSPLFERGCRIWYYTGKAKNDAEAKAVNARIEKASLALLYLTGNIVDDYSAKSDILYAQKSGIPIIVFKKDSSIKTLSIGIKESYPEVESEDDIIRADGFDANLIGEKTHSSYRLLKAISISLILLSLILGVFAYVNRERLNTSLSSPDKVSVITVGKDNYDFSQYPNLEKIIIPQSRASEYLNYLDTYEIVLVEG